MLSEPQFEGHHWRIEDAGGGAFRIRSTSNGWILQCHAHQPSGSEPFSQRSVIRFGMCCVAGDFRKQHSFWVMLSEPQYEGHHWLIS